MDIAGTDADDILTGTAGDDVINGGKGNDRLDGGDGNDILHGGDGNDAIMGGPGADWMDGGAGDDRFFLNNSFDLSSGDRISGGDGYDTIFVNGSVDFTGVTVDADVEAIAGTGNATITRSQLAQFQSITGNFQVKGSGTLDLTGNRLVSVSLQLDAGEDSVTLAGNQQNGFVYINGGGGNDTLIGSDGNDGFDGDAGNDRLEGRGGNDVMDGGGGDDVLLGGAGNDILFNSAGVDHLEGGDGDDEIRIDLSAGVAAGDYFSGGAGIDTLSLSRSFTTIDLATIPHVDDFERIVADNATLSISGEAFSHFVGVQTSGLIFTSAVNFVWTPNQYTASTIKLSDQASKVDLNAVSAGLSFVFEISGGAGNDVVIGSSYDDQVRGGGGDDTIRTAAGNDLIDGGAGNDTIDGGSSDDHLYGGDGADIIIGGGGGDTIDGGAGADRIVYRSAAESILGAGDYLTAFQHGTDLIDLSAIGVTGITFQSGGDGTTTASIGTASGVTMTIRIDGVATLADFILPTGTFTPPAIPTLPAPGAIANPPAAPGPVNVTLNLYDSNDYVVATGAYLRTAGGFSSLFYDGASQLINNGGIYAENIVTLSPFWGFSSLENNGNIVFSQSSDVHILDEFHTAVNTGQIFAVSSGFARVFQSFYDVTIINSGLLAASSASSGAVVINLPEFAGHIVNTASGQIIAEGRNVVALSLGISSNNTPYDVENAGAIVARATVAGGHPAVGVSMEYGKVLNTGTIIADIGVAGTGKIVNSGTITASLASVEGIGIITFENLASGVAHGDVYGGTEADVIANAGLIDGNAFLDNGDDVFTNSGNGYITGIVDLGLGHDRYTGSSGVDRVAGDNGDDQIDGGGGNDLLIAGNGNDVLVGGAGNDGLYGERGNDTIVTAGGDYVSGGRDNDRIELGDYSFALADGGSGIDTLVLPTGARLLDLSAAITTGRITGIEIIEMRGGQELVVRAGNAHTLINAGDTLRIDAAASDKVDLVGAWTNAGAVTIEGTQYARYILGNEAIAVKNGATVQIVANPPAGATGLDPIAAGPSAPLPGVDSGLTLTSDVLYVSNLTISAPTTIYEGETWYTIGKVAAVVSPGNPGALTILGTLQASNADQATVVAIDFAYGAKVDNAGTITAKSTGALQHDRPDDSTSTDEGAYAIRTALPIVNRGRIEAYAQFGVAAAMGTFEHVPGDANRGTAEYYIVRDPAPMVDNSGIIRAVSDALFAVAVVGSGRFNNSGDIYAFGAKGAVGVIAEGDMFNSGTIIAASNAHAIGLIIISGGVDNHLHNSGTISGDDAIQITGDLPTIIENDGTISGKIIGGIGIDQIINRHVIVGDVLLGQGNDRFDGRAGSQVGVVNGGEGNDTLMGGIANDMLDGGTGVDQLFGGQGNDTYYADRADDLVFENTNEGTDTVIASAGFYLYANIENLTLAAGAGDIFGVGNELANVMTGNEGSNLLIAGAGDDVVHGGAGVDSLFGQDGNDQLFGDAGVDYLVGGAGDDMLDGGTGADALYGEDGDDVLWGGTDFQTDILVGGAGNDILHGDSGFGDYDLMDGGSGDDTYYVDTPADLTFEAVGGGTDTVHANIIGAGYYLYANVENLILDGVTPFGVGNELNNQLTGNATSNYLLGGAGNDTLNGKAGNDVLFGESDADTFVFEHGTGADVIGDFTPGTDKIDLTAIGYSWAQVQAAMHENNGSTAIDLLYGDLVVLNGVTIAQLHQSDFVLRNGGAGASGDAPAPQATAPAQGVEGFQVGGAYSGLGLPVPDGALSDSTAFMVSETPWFDHRAGENTVMDMRWHDAITIPVDPATIVLA